MEGYGLPVDMWGLGVIVYFMLAGTTPFYSDTEVTAELTLNTQQITNKLVFFFIIGNDQCSH